MQNIQTAND